MHDKKQEDVVLLFGRENIFPVTVALVTRSFFITRPAFKCAIKNIQGSLKHNACRAFKIRKIGHLWQVIPSCIHRHPIYFNDFYFINCVVFENFSETGAITTSNDS